MIGYEAETVQELMKSDIRTVLEAIITPERRRIEDLAGVVEKCGAFVRKYTRRKDDTRQRSKLTRDLAFLGPCCHWSCTTVVCSKHEMEWINQESQCGEQRARRLNTNMNTKQTTTTTWFPMVMTSETSNPDGAKKRQTPNRDVQKNNNRSCVRYICITFSQNQPTTTCKHTRQRTTYTASFHTVR